MVMGHAILVVTATATWVIAVQIAQPSAQMNVHTMDNALRELAFVSQDSWVSIAPSWAAAVVMVVVMMIQQHVSATLGGQELTALSG
jgi:hypothetical protein